MSGPLPCLSCPAVPSQTSGFIYLLILTPKVECNRREDNNQGLETTALKTPLTESQYFDVSFFSTLPACICLDLLRQHGAANAEPAGEEFPQCQRLPGRYLRWRAGASVSAAQLPVLDHLHLLLSRLPRQHRGSGLLHHGEEIFQ